MDIKTRSSSAAEAAARVGQGQQQGWDKGSRGSSRSSSRTKAAASPTMGEKLQKIEVTGAGSAVGIRCGSWPEHQQQWQQLH